MGRKFALLGGAASVVILLDQLSKAWIRSNEVWQYRDLIEGWLAFHYIHNPGMAMGIDFLDTRIVSLLALAATIGISIYVIKNMAASTQGYALLMGLILGGAVGNLIDRFWLAIAGGYGGVLEGHVTDFIHFTLEIGDVPVFPFIFNVADMAISTSVVILLIFSKKFMPPEPKPEPKVEVEV